MPPPNLVGQTGEFARATAAADDPAFFVAGEERRVGRRVVVVQQLEQEAETALRATLGHVAKTGGPLSLRSPVAAVRADEQMGHYESGG